MADHSLTIHRRLASLVVLLAGLEFGLVGLLNGLENELSDSFIRLQAPALLADTDIVIIDINEYSLGKMAPEAGRYPWPRAIQAELLEGVLAQRPRAVVYDILFSGRDNALLADSDSYFADVIARTDKVYFPFTLLGEDTQTPSQLVISEYAAALGFEPTDRADPNATLEAELPFAAAVKTGRLGTINFEPNIDGDGIGRHYALFRERGGWRIPSLPARLARDLHFPLTVGDSFILHWRGGISAHTRIPFFDLYADFTREKRQRPANELQDKIVIIGSTASSLYDQNSTPISSIHPGVEVLATAIDNLKNQQYMQRLPGFVAPTITLLLLLALYFSFKQSRNPFRIFLGMLLLTPIMLYLGYFSVQQRLLLPVFTPLVFAWIYYAMAALSEYLQERRARQRSVDMFGRFLDPRVVKDLVSEGTQALNDYVNARERELSVLFSDIRGFTTLSESRSAEEIVSLLNRYFSRQTHVIFAHSGTVDKFIGDAIMAFWGAPIANKTHACDAVAAALDMVDALLDFREELGGDIGQSFNIGIGIHSGPAVVGLIGSDNRLDYTCIGDTVNLASRIEGKTKDVGVRVLVSGATREQCGDMFDFIAHGSYKVKGREQEVLLFEPRRHGS